MAKKKKKLKKSKKKARRDNKIKRLSSTSIEQDNIPSIVKSYFKYHKLLLLIPILMLILSLIQIGIQYGQTGSFLKKGISLKGGTEIYFPTNGKKINLNDFENYLKSKLDEVRVREISEFGRISGYIVETTEHDIEKLKNILSSYQKYHIDLTKLSFKTIGAELSQSFFKEIINALIWAFILMAIVVFLRFRALPVSLAVILSAFSDIVVTVAILNLIDFKFSVAGIAALLMLIGYSVDTDILLSTRLLKEHGKLERKFIDAFKTGITMTITTLATVTIGYLISNSIVIKEIMFILFIGLLVDIINTWIQNATILIWYVEKKEHQ